MERKPYAQTVNKQGFFAYLVIHAEKDGILAKVTIDDRLNDKIVERHDYIPAGGHVRSFRGANAAIGIVIAKFDSMDEMQQVSNHLNEYIHVESIPLVV